MSIAFDREEYFKIMLKRRFIFIVLAFLAIASNTGVPANALSPASAGSIGTLLLKGSKFFQRALPATKVDEFAKIAAKPGGTAIVGAELGRLKLPTEVIEDTFARILVAQGHVHEKEAEGWIRRLSGVEGFSAAMRKSMGASPANTIGHLNEVRIADQAALGNFRVRGIGVPFKDPNKSGLTDIDVLLEKKGRLIAIEAKAYSSDGAIPMDVFRADMVTLAEYRAANKNSEVFTVFSLTNKPADPGTWKLLQSAADQHKVTLLAGSAEDLMHQIPILIP